MLPLDHFQAGSWPYTVPEIEGAPDLEYDYDDIIAPMWITKGGRAVGEPVSYRRLYETFCVSDAGLVALVKTSLLQFPKSRGYVENVVLDPSYWELVMAYSVIDAIIGEQPSTYKANCPTCGKKTSSSQAPH